MELLDEQWPESPQASLARCILPDYLRLGPVRFVLNADVKLRLWRTRDQVLPLVYRERDSTSRAADVCSPWTHYVRYPLGKSTATAGASLRRSVEVYCA